MILEPLIAQAKEQGASDLHLEPGLPAAVRVRGALRTFGDPMPAKMLSEAALELLGAENWPLFVERRSFDLSRTIHQVRCRINILHSARGIGLAIRLLASFQATLDRLNLHPDLKKFITATNGLILVSGPTGSGKSSTLAALIQEINLAEARHIVTVESPIEYTFRPVRSFIRQREVGRDTPSFERALLDALREDPDVLMIGEMREPETMRLTLNASETGHLVLATVHSSSCAEALQRIVAAFPSEIQGSVSAQLADCLVGVIAQRLRFRPELNLRVPECEIVTPTYSVKSYIRNRDFFKMTSSIETGAEKGMWTFDRYRTWLDKRTKWFVPEPSWEPPDDTPVAAAAPASVASGVPAAHPMPASEKMAEPSNASLLAKPKGPIEIEPVEGGIDALIKKLSK
jgi:twitching motility protein PilT